MSLGRCKSNNKVDSSLISQALRGKMINDHEFDCFIACILQGIGVVSIHILQPFLFNKLNKLISNHILFLFISDV